MSNLPAPETLRESWCLLVLETDDETLPRKLTRWAVGDANADDLIRTQEVTIDDAGSEAEILAALGAQLNERRYEDTTVITASERTLDILRSRFLNTNVIEVATLRGFRHLALRSLVSQYFDETSLSKDPPSSVINCHGQSDSNKGPNLETLWEVRKQVGPLVPADALRGTPL